MYDRIKDARIFGCENKTEGLASTVHLYVLIPQLFRFTGAHTVVKYSFQPQNYCCATIVVT
jgi:hypothetical protein